MDLDVLDSPSKSDVEPPLPKGQSLGAWDCLMWNSMRPHPPVIACANSASLSNPRVSTAERLRFGRQSAADPECCSRPCDNDGVLAVSAAGIVAGCVFIAVSAFVALHSGAPGDATCERTRFVPSTEFSAWPPGALCGYGGPVRTEVVVNDCAPQSSAYWP